MAPHDPAYKQLFSHPDMVADLVRGYVEEDWVAELDFTTLERVADSFVSDDLREREDDIIWRVRWGGRWLYLYLLIEFQSSVDRFMAVRLLTYIGLLYQDLIAHARPGPKERLPPVLPIVLYNGEERWWARTDLSDLQEINLPASLARFQPRLQYVLLDEGCYAEHPLPATRNLAAALFGLENSRSPEDLIAVLERLVTWLRDPAQTPLRRAFLVWLKRIALKNHLPAQEFEEIHELQEMYAMLAERIKTWPEQWEQRGMEKGLKQGLERGLEQGERRALSRLLQRRFGSLPDWVDARLNAASLAQLEAWSLAFVDAESLATVFGEDAPH